MHSRALLAAFFFCLLASKLHSYPISVSTRQETSAEDPDGLDVTESPTGPLPTLEPSQEPEIATLPLTLEPMEDESPAINEFSEENAVEIPPPGPADDIGDPSEPSSEPSLSDYPVFTFAYNVGGNKSGAYEADPSDWLVGETATFVVDDAMIVGDDKRAEIYKSHRFGLHGSTWGYDFPVPAAAVYNCVLLFAETYSHNFGDDPNRTFTVEMYGDGSQNVQSRSFDVMEELGGAEFTAYTKRFKNIEAVTTLSLRETATTGDAFLAGIRCKSTGPLMMA